MDGTYFRSEQGRLERLDTVAQSKSENAYVRGTNFFGMERVAEAARQATVAPQIPPYPTTEQGVPSPQHAPLTPAEKMTRLREKLTEEKRKGLENSSGDNKSNGLRRPDEEQAASGGKPRYSAKVEKSFPDVGIQGNTTSPGGESVAAPDQFRIDTPTREDLEAEIQQLRQALRQSQVEANQQAALAQANEAWGAGLSLTARRPTDGLKEGLSDIAAILKEGKTYLGTTAIVPAFELPWGLPPTSAVYAAEKGGPRVHRNLTSLYNTREQLKRWLRASYPKHAEAIHQKIFDSVDDLHKQHRALAGKKMRYRDELNVHLVDESGMTQHKNFFNRVHEMWYSVQTKAVDLLVLRERHAATRTDGSSLSSYRSFVLIFWELEKRLGVSDPEHLLELEAQVESPSCAKHGQPSKQEVEEWRLLAISVAELRLLSWHRVAAGARKIVAAAEPHMTTAELVDFREILRDSDLDTWDPSGDSVGAVMTALMPHLRTSEVCKKWLNGTCMEEHKCHATTGRTHPKDEASLAQRRAGLDNAKKKKSAAATEAVAAAATKAAADAAAAATAAAAAAAPQAKAPPSNKRKIPKAQLACRFYLLGKCAKDKCDYKHDRGDLERYQKAIKDGTQPMCLLEKSGKCTYGKTCLFKHAAATVVSYPVWATVAASAWEWFPSDQYIFLFDTGANVFVIPLGHALLVEVCSSVANLSVVSTSSVVKRGIMKHPIFEDRTVPCVIGFPPIFPANEATTYTHLGMTIESEEAVAVYPFIRTYGLPLVDFAAETPFAAAPSWRKTLFPDQKKDGDDDQRDEDGGEDQLDEDGDEPAPVARRLAFGADANAPTSPVVAAPCDASLPPLIEQPAPIDWHKCLHNAADCRHNECRVGKAAHGVRGSSVRGSARVTVEAIDADEAMMTFDFTGPEGVPSCCGRGLERRHPVHLRSGRRSLGKQEARLP